VTLDDVFKPSEVLTGPLCGRFPVASCPKKVCLGIRLSGMRMMWPTQRSYDSLIIAPPGVPRVTKQLLSSRTRVSQLLNIDEQSGSSAHDHSTTLVPGRAAAAPGSKTPELDSTHMNGLTDDKKRSVVPTAQSKELYSPNSDTFAVNGKKILKATFYFK